MYSPPKILLPLLWPLSLIYGAAVVARAWLYKVGILKQKRLNGVVISVGNLTVGGTGKTPMVMWLAERLKDHTQQAILIRGYRGSGENSDEANLLRTRMGDDVRVGVGPDRWQTGSRLVGQGVRRFILDDGLQHLQLARDVEIVLIDATDPFGGGLLLPAGRLREPRSALDRAHVVVITRSSHAPALEAAIRRHTGARIYYAEMQFERLETFAATPHQDGRKAESRFFAFSGLGNPDAFFSDIRGWGLNVTGQRAFPDHHKYTGQDLREIVGAARTANAEALVCTEKDFQNLDTGALQALQGMALTWCVASLKILDEAGLLASVREAIQTSHRARGAS